MASFISCILKNTLEIEKRKQRPYALLVILVSITTRYGMTLHN